MIRMLASVTNIAEASMALEAGADIIDLKNPAEGALGALPLEIIAAVVCEVSGRRLISATIGDLPMQPALVLRAAEAVAATGVDIVKIGFFGQQDLRDCVCAIAPLAQRQKIAAVLFADQHPDLSLLPDLADAGFHGVMLDTALKNSRRLPDFLTPDELKQFIKQAKALGLMTGLAGSLCVDDIALLAPLAPDYLGFRGALCEASNRTNALSSGRMERLLALLHANNKINVTPSYYVA